jgi:hypothetical protein
MPPKKRPKETLDERGRRLGWAPKRKAVVAKAEVAALAWVREWYEKSGTGAAAVRASHTERSS